MSDSVVNTQAKLETYLGVQIPPQPAVPGEIVTALVLQYLALKELVGNGQPAQRLARLRSVLLGLKDGNIWSVDRLPRIVFMRSLFKANILQIPQVANLLAADRDWSAFCIAARNSDFAVRQGLGKLAEGLGCSMVGTEAANRTALVRLKEAFANIQPNDVPLAMKIAAHFGANPQPGRFLTAALLPAWLTIWRKTPPGSKPIDVAFNLPKLQPHFEKHVCHVTNEPHPIDECIAWMEVLRYDEKITLDFLKTFRVRPTADHTAIMFPAGGVTVDSVAPMADETGGKSVQTVPGLAKTLAARRCFVEHYLSQSPQLVASLWRDYAKRYETISTNTLNACKDGFLYFEQDTGKIFFVGSVAANVAVDAKMYVFFVMARFYGETGTWEFSTLYMPDHDDNSARKAAMRLNGHLWDGAIQ